LRDLEAEGAGDRRVQGDRAAVRAEDAQSGGDRDGLTRCERMIGQEASALPVGVGLKAARVRPGPRADNLHGADRGRGDTLERDLSGRTVVLAPRNRKYGNRPGAAAAMLP
jgi:hypothetical protein